MTSSKSSFADLNIDQHKLNILEERIRGGPSNGNNREGIIEELGFSPPRSVLRGVSPVDGCDGGNNTNSGCGGGSRSRSGSVSNLTTATSTSFDGASVSFEQEQHANDNANSNASCQTVHHANIMKSSDTTTGNGAKKKKGSLEGGGSGSSNSKKEGKKKSTPSKRPVSAIGDRQCQQHATPTMNKSNKANTTTNNSGSGGGNKGSGSGGQKKMRIKKPTSSTDNKGADGGRTTTITSSSSSNTTTTNNAITTSTTSDQTSRDTLHSYFGTSTTATSSSSSNPAASRSQLSSPPALQSKQHHQTREGSSKMANQRTLHSFLGIGSKKQRHDDDDDYDDGEGEKKRKAGESNNDGKVAAASKDDVAASATSNTKKKRSSLKSTSGSTTPSTNIHHHLNEQDHHESTQNEIKRLHSQIITLQKQLDDATSRNNSIRNNQTLISTNLQRQLKNQKIEYDKLRDECNSKMEKAMDIVERFVRDESVRTSADLRQKLASDGARLGRLVSSRVSSNHHGMMMGGRTQFIESWEDGYAPKRLKMKREELRMRREELERRKNELLLLDNKNDNNGSGSINDESNSTITNVSDNNHDDESSELLTTMNDLDRMEAHETVRMHIDEIKRQEMELDNEEKVLNIEKRGHVRALKLLSNEDSSKFRVHRKVRLVFWYLEKEY